MSSQLGYFEQPASLKDLRDFVRNARGLLPNPTLTISGLSIDFGESSDVVFGPTIISHATATYKVGAYEVTVTDNDALEEVGSHLLQVKTRSKVYGLFAENTTQYVTHYVVDPDFYDSDIPSTDYQIQAHASVLETLVTEHDRSDKKHFTHRPIRPARPFSLGDCMVTNELMHRCDSGHQLEE